MTVKTYFTILAIVGVIFGVGFVLAPEQVGSIYGFKPSPDTALTARFFGGALLAWALIGWFAKDFQDEEALRGILIANGIGHAVSFVVAVMGVLSGVMNAVGWSSVLIYLFGAVGSAYFLMSRPHRALAA